MMMVYVAGASGDIERAEAAIRALRLIAGVAVPFDWTVELRRLRPEHPTDESMSWLMRYGGASHCAHAIRSSSIVWVLSPEVPTLGTWVELGIALERQESELLTVIASGRRGTTSFLDLVHPENHFDTDNLALARIAEIARAAA